MFAELLAGRLAGICRLSEDQIKRLEQHYNLMLRWNRVLNLTTIRAVAEVVERHYCESVFLGAHLPAGALTVADIGSGAGFPGVPVAVLRPDCQVTLIESHCRKAVFLREATRGLKNVRVLAERAEAVGETFDAAVSRAVSEKTLAAIVGRLAPRILWLCGQSAGHEVTGILWQPPMRLPWGNKRFLRMGSVSRETSFT